MTDVITRDEMDENRPRLFTVGDESSGWTVDALLHPVCFINFCTGGRPELCTKCSRRLEYKIQHGPYRHDPNIDTAAEGDG